MYGENKPRTLARVVQSYLVLQEACFVLRPDQSFLLFLVRLKLVNYLDELNMFLTNRPP